MTTIAKYQGCFMGLAIGDALGAPYEGGYVERLLWKLIGKTRSSEFRYTDDTQMSIDLANSFIVNKKIDQERLASTFAKSYRCSRGYGPSAAKLLKLIKQGTKWQDANRIKFENGSFGNGAAMRAPVVALCYSYSLGELKENVLKSSEITHAHPLAIEGAQPIALMVSNRLNNVTSYMWKIRHISLSLPSKYSNYRLSESSTWAKKIVALVS